MGQSTRGLKQGDLLSTTLFIIIFEVLLRSLNRDRNFIGYGLPKWRPEINHFSYADDRVLFCSSNRAYVIKMINVLRSYEKVFGQLVNKSKSCFYLHEKTPLIFSIMLRKLTRINKVNFLSYILDALYFMEGRSVCTLRR